MSKQTDPQIIATVPYNSTEYENEILGDGAFPVLVNIQVTPDLYLTPEEHQGNLDYDAMRDDELQEKLDNETPNDNPVY